MSSPLAINTNKPSGGLCPHGLPPSACPICSGGMGGMKKADFSAKPGEMSWNECAAIGAMLRAQKLRAQQKDIDHQNRLLSIAKFEANMRAVTQKLAVVAAKFAEMQSILARPVNVLFNKVLIPTATFMKNIPVNAMKFSMAMVNKFVDIQDKLNAVFGEMKSSIDKLVSEKLASFKKKITWLFGEYEEDGYDDEFQKQLEPSKRTFEARTFVHDVYTKITKIFKNYDDIKKEKDGTTD